MNKKYSNILLGCCLVAIGIVMIGNYFNLFSINIFFNGWWTLFIIIPSIIGLFNKGDKTLNLLFLAIGILLLLNQYDIIPNDILFKVILAVAIIITGIKIIMHGVKSPKSNSENNIPNFPNNQNEYDVIFGKQEKIYSKGEEFIGTNLKSIFGEVTLNIKDSSINKDVYINAKTRFGNCTIIAPVNVNIKIFSKNMFGKTINKKSDTFKNEFPTIYINSDVIFGEIKIK